MKSLWGGPLQGPFFPSLHLEEQPFGGIAPNPWFGQTLGGWSCPVGSGFVFWFPDHFDGIGYAADFLNPPFYNRRVPF